MRFSMYLIWVLIISASGTFLSVASSRASSRDLQHTKIVNLGSQLPGQLLVVRETLQNTYRSTLNFMALHTSCGCLSGVVDPLVLKSRDRAKLVLRLLTHGASGRAEVSALLVGHTGRHTVYKRYVVKNHVRQMVNIFGPGHGALTPGYVDIGSVPFTKLSTSISLRVVRGGFNARWGKLECFSGNSAVVAEVHPMYAGLWRVSLHFITSDMIGPQSVDLRFLFLHGGKPLRYQLNEVVSLNVVGPITLCPRAVVSG